MSAVLLTISFTACIDASAPPPAADDTSQTAAAETTTCTQVQLCCADLGLPTDPTIAAVLGLLGLTAPANELVGLTCSLTDPLTCHQTSLCCSSSVSGLGGTIGLGCTID